MRDVRSAVSSRASETERPGLLALRPDAVPEALRACDRWVVWEAVWRHDSEEAAGGKWSKMPYSATTGAHASASDPATWTRFDDAVAAVAASEGRFAGVGLVLTGADTLCVVDIEDAVNDTGGLTPEAAAVVSRLDSYTERTPSGRGVRVFLDANLPPGGRRRGPFGFFDGDRFVCVTGWRLPASPEALCTPQGEIEELHAELFPPAPPRPAGGASATPPATDRELLELAFRGANGDRVAALFNGDVGAVSTDRNGADLALCSMLGFYTGDDPTRLDRLFRASRLFRNKWDAPHYSDGRTYGQAVVAKALEGCLLFYSAPVARGAALPKIRTARTTPRVTPVALPVEAQGETESAPVVTTPATQIVPVPVVPSLLDSGLNPVALAEAQGRAQGLAMSEKVLTAREAAAILRVSPRMVRRCMAPWKRFGSSPSGDRWLLSDLLAKVGED